MTFPREEIEWRDQMIRELRAKLEQIAIVCTDNMDADCNHRMALDFVREIANQQRQD